MMAPVTVRTVLATISVKGVAIAEHGTEEYTNYGAPVSIRAPPASRVVSLQQFEQAAASATAASVS